MKITRLQRVLKLLTLLQSNRNYRPSQLAQELGVTRRTIFRDLQMLYKAGIPCYYDDDKGGYNIDDDIFLQPLNLKLSEALSLLLVTQYSGNDGGFPLQREAREAALKIESVLPSHIQQHCGSLLSTTSARFASKARHHGLDGAMKALQQAIHQNRKVKITYLSFHDAKQVAIILSPYHLHFAKRAWYVIGESSFHKEIRTFKLGRIKNLQVLDKKYVLEKPFHMEDYLGDAWSIIPEGKIYQVKLHFSALVAANVAEVLWHRKQKLTWHHDQTLTFEVQVDGLGEIMWWILGYGAQVEVLTPAILRRRVTQTAQNMTKLYDLAE